MGDARDCESYLRQLQDSIKRQYTCDKNSRLSRLEDLLQDSMVTNSHLSLVILFICFFPPLKNEYSYCVCGSGEFMPMWRSDVF